MNRYKKTRWLVVLGAVLVQICLGSIYTWSLFNQPLIDKFGWDQSAIVLTFSITVAMFAFSTIFAGKLQNKIGPKKVAILGGLLLGIGLILSSKATSLIELYIYFGVIGGTGVGTAYVAPLTTCIKWFPDKRGFITGIAVSSFGLGSLIFKSLVLDLILTKGVSQTFLYLGVINLILIVLGAQTLSTPPTDYETTGVTEGVESNSKDSTSTQMISTKQFYLLWIVYFFGCISGLLIIGLAQDIGIDLVKLTPRTAASAITVIALFNAGGRLAWGVVSDKIGRKTSLLIIYLTTSIAMAIMSTITMNTVIFFVSVSMIALSFGGLVTVVPAITADYYGVKNIASNYGVVFQAFGIAAIAGPIIATNFGLNNSFLIAAALSIFSMIITIFIKPPFALSR
ncbi:OFA family MFS transporter [Neobacillus sp. WH10]|uniref:L-lactate MFS transporter n=1 Tax=Neobacillus sp. WH10 TaxID=3047873 RepID=UPI0024C1BCE7|nr:OFA family MFS transporter [Neobacillus sp. WH10]WHY78416.1 OFA family MFS transporter [Neobacillus sp. WH10]